MQMQLDYNRNTIIDILRIGTKTYGDKTVLRKRTDSGWVDISWNQVYTEVEALASYLIKTGFRKGDIAAIYSANRPEWVVADFATLFCAGVDASIYPTNSASEAAYILDDTKAVVCFCDGSFQVDNVLAERKNLPNLKKIIVFSDIDCSDDMVIRYSDAIKEGEKNLQTNEIEARIATVKPEDLLTLIYSSGTTGQPKGVMQSHKNVMYVSMTFARTQCITPEDMLISILPLAHSVERSLSYYAFILAGGVMSFSRGQEFFAEDLVELRPTLSAFVPRIFEKIYNGIHTKVAAAPEGKQKLFAKAMSIAKQAAPYFMADKKLPFILGFKYAIFDKLLYSKLKEAIGFDRYKGIGSAGAPLLPEIHDFFWGLKVEIRKGYGLTETAPVLALDPHLSVNKVKTDLWMAPFPEVELKIAEDGEVLAKSPGVMTGYYNKPEQTKEVFTSDGWFKTGDIGIIDNEGYLKITDRKKDIIVTSGGKNVAPQVLENAFASNSFIEQIAVIGDGRQYITALIVPSFETLKDWAAREGLGSLSNEELVVHENVIGKYNKIVEEINQHFGRVEQIKKFKLMPKEFSQENGELTPTLKLKRKVLLKNYKDDIDALYKD
ncbi:MAG TPA: long-chain fatty acid--CoA ligase [Spirochaetota bacterium]|nr:long-chain fatty acid--CoA ligase [Spirochaetota bacterium]